MATNNKSMHQKGNVVTVSGISQSALVSALVKRRYNQTEDIAEYDKLSTIAEKLSQSDMVEVEYKGVKFHFVSSSKTSVKIDNVVKQGETSLGYVVTISISQSDLTRVAYEIAKQCKVEHDDGSFHYEMEGVMVLSQDIQNKAKNILSNAIDLRISDMKGLLRSNADLACLPAIKYLKEYPEAMELSKEIDAIAFDVDGNIRPEVRSILTASKALGNLPDTKSMKAILAKKAKS